MAVFYNDDNNNSNDNTVMQGIEYKIIACWLLQVDDKIPEVSLQAIDSCLSIFFVCTLVHFATLNCPFKRSQLA